jgi:hypothetical protein
MTEEVYWRLVSDTIAKHIKEDIAAGKYKAEDLVFKKSKKRKERGLCPGNSTKKVIA